MLRISIRYAILLLIAAFQCPHASVGIRQDGHLDMPVLRKAYMESEFERVQSSLETFLRHPPDTATREEMIFTHMYLGVIYAADSSSEAKAESHFNALLRLSPHIEPVDMFVPPKIQDLFDRIKRDFMKQAQYREKFDAFGNPIAPTGGETAPKGKKDPEVSGSGHAWVWWTMGSAAVLAAGTGIYLLSAEKTPDARRVEADGRLP
jgi:hypothetical protein